ncbi:hypothetical protein EOD41_04785 [Mucilaginibacter limnophilus]|uniref:Universal stress protein n=1 Tax=Mucilaginibacter limnophilus TaxID=1932778 RepID=A0A3S2V8L2_9SPHI|nr:hypothetical protein [Mucilaginibacter limnophilus]RVU01286.1 hypothetical protein EOD41_04785 [Mucilaginibacter limnophilus]
MQTILVPTDFNIKALDCVSAISKQYEGEDISFIFVHMFKLSDSITDLLMLSRRSREFELIDNDFYNRCNEIKAQNDNVKAIRVEFLYGSTLSMFRNFIEANEVTHVLKAEHCSIGKLHKSSINPMTLIQKCGLPEIYIKPVPAEPVTVKKQNQELELSEV